MYNSFLNRGAAVVGIDIDSSIETNYKHKNYLGLICDVTEEDEIEEILEKSVCHFGGLDMIVLNAGIFPEGKMVSQLSMKEWNQVFSINLNSNLNLLREVYPLIKVAPNKGRVVIIGSKKCSSSRSWCGSLLSF